MKANVQKIYLPYQEDERGLLNLEREQVAMNGINRWMAHKDDIWTKVFFMHQR